MKKEGISNKILTIPNILSFVRLLLIPLIIWLYYVEKNSYGAAAVLILSGLTDTVDGYIARRFNMISELGKALDPVADKLTQIAMLFCLIDSFPMMRIPFILLVIKEVFSAILNLAIIRNTKKVNGAVWHGKVTTIMLYAMMVIHILWPQIPGSVSCILIGMCLAMMLLSFVMYSKQNIKELKDN